MAPVLPSAPARVSVGSVAVTAGNGRGFSCPASLSRIAYAAVSDACFTMYFVGSGVMLGCANCGLPAGRGPVLAAGGACTGVVCCWPLGGFFGLDLAFNGNLRLYSDAKAPPRFMQTRNSCYKSFKLSSISFWVPS